MRLAVVVLTVVSGAALWAQDAQRPAAPPPPARQAIAALRNQLGLTDQQVQQLTQLRREQEQVLQPLRQQIQEKAKALRDLMAAPSPDPAVVGSLTLELRNLRQQVRQTNETYHERALAVLTPEQKTKLENLQNAARRAARIGPAVRAATLLNLILPPAAAAGEGQAVEGTAPARRMVQGGPVR